VTSGTVSTRYAHSSVIARTGSYTVQTSAATSIITLRSGTNASPGSINFSANGNTTTHWQMLGVSSGELTSATSNINLTGGNVINVNSGGNSTSIQPAAILLGFGAATTNIFGNSMTTTGSSFIRNLATAGSIFTMSTNAGLINFSANNNVSNALQITTSNETALPLVTSAPFLTTNGSGIIAAGTILAIANGGTGNATGPVVSTIQGGMAGNVVYQSATNITAFLANSNGVLQMIGSTPAWTDVPSTIRTITAPASQNLLLTNPNASNTIALSTNAGNMTFSTGTGVWTMAATTADLSSSTANISLNGSNTISVGTSSIANTLIQVVSGGLTSSMINGTVTSSSASDISILQPSLIKTSNLAGTFFSQLSPTNVNISSPAGYTATLSTTGLALNRTAPDIFALRNFNGGLQLITSTANIDFSINGINNCFTCLGASNQVRIDQLTNAPFVKTNGSGVVEAGTVLAVANGGTGVSVVTKPNTTYPVSGNITLTGVCKYFTVQLIGGGGGGGGSSTATAAAGGGGGGGRALSHYLYNAGVGFYSVSLGAAGAGGVGSANGGTGGNSEFSVNAVVDMRAFGGSGGFGTSTVNSGGGVAGGSNLGDERYSGGDGGWGIGTLGGFGGSSSSGITTNTSGSGSYAGIDAAGNGGGGCGGNNGDGGNGRVGDCILTEYYY